MEVETEPNVYDQSRLAQAENWDYFGPSGVRALPLGVAAKRSVHYIWYYFSFCATYFSPRRG